MPIQTAAEPSFGDVARQMSRMVDQLQKGFFGFRPNENWTPSVNLYEDEHAYLLCVDLAGVDKDKIDVVVVDNQLRLRGGRPAPIPAGHEHHHHGQTRLRVHLMEIDHGAFSREVELPNDVDRENVQASYQNGMLWVVLPKK